MKINVEDKSETSFALRVGGCFYFIEKPAYSFLQQGITEAEFDANYQPQDEDEPDWSPHHEGNDDYPDITDPNEPDGWDEVR